MKAKIVSVSKYGITTEDSEDWISFDKYLKNKPELKRGDIVEFELNKAGFIKKIEKVENVQIMSKKDLILSGKIPETSTQDRILKGQCLNVVFDNFNRKGANLNTDVVREHIYNLADTIFKELKQRGY